MERLLIIVYDGIMASDLSARVNKYVISQGCWLNNPGGWRIFLSSRDFHDLALELARRFYPQEPEDLVQELLTQWLERPPAFQGNSQFSTYLAKALQNKKNDLHGVYRPKGIPGGRDPKADVYHALQRGDSQGEILGMLANHLDSAQDCLDLLEEVQEAIRQSRGPVKRANVLLFPSVGGDEDPGASYRNFPDSTSFSDHVILNDLERSLVESLPEEWQKAYILFREGKAESMETAGAMVGITSARYHWQQIQKRLLRRL